MALSGDAQNLRYPNFAKGSIKCASGRRSMPRGALRNMLQLSVNVDVLAACRSTLRSVRKRGQLNALLPQFWHRSIKVRSACSLLTCKERKVAHNPYAEERNR